MEGKIYQNIGWQIILSLGNYTLAEIFALAWIYTLARKYVYIGWEIIH